MSARLAQIRNDIDETKAILRCAITNGEKELIVSCMNVLAKQQEKENLLLAQEFGTTPAGAPSL
jgi:hypothetical protein